MNLTQYREQYYTLFNSITNDNAWVIADKMDNLDKRFSTIASPYQIGDKVFKDGSLWTITYICPHPEGMPGNGFWYRLEAAGRKRRTIDQHLIGAA